MPALAEAIRIGREPSSGLEIFHLKSHGQAPLGRMKNVVAAIQIARDSGLDIAADMYPYTAALRRLLPRFTLGRRWRSPEIVCALKRPRHSRAHQKDLAGDTPTGKTSSMIARRCGGSHPSAENPELKHFSGKRSISCKSVEEISRRTR